MKKKINILYIIDYLHGHGGTEKHLTYLVEMLDKKKYNLYIISFDLGQTNITEKIKSSGVPLIHFPVGKYYTINAFKMAFELRRFIKNKEIDIVQTFHIKSDFYGAIVARLSGVTRIISSKRDVGDLKSKWHFFLNRLVRIITSRYIVVSEAVGKVVLEKEKAQKGKLSVIYNGVDLNYFFSSESIDIARYRKKLGISSNDFVLVTVAWMRPEKNYNVLFSAFEHVMGKIKEIKLIIVGAGPLLKFYKNYVRRNGLEKKVIFVGSTNDVRPFLQVADVACLVPGGNEGFSNSVIEKMAMGLPLIVSDVGGNAEAVVDGYNGFVIPPNNSEKLAESLIYLAEHPDERRKMGFRSAQRVRKMFTLERMIKAHEELYESLLVVG